MSKASNCLSSQISYIHYPQCQTGSGNIHSPTSIGRELTSGSQRENLTSRSPKYACEAFCTQAIAAFSVCWRHDVRKQQLRSKGQKVRTRPVSSDNGLVQVSAPWGNHQKENIIRLKKILCY